MDVDEIFRPPKPRIPKGRRKKKKSNSHTKFTSVGNDAKKANTNNDSKKDSEDDVDGLSEQLKRLQKELASLGSDEESTNDGAAGSSTSEKSRPRKGTPDLRDKLNKRKTEDKSRRHDDRAHSRSSHSRRSPERNYRDQHRSRHRDQSPRRHDHGMYAERDSYRKSRARDAETHSQTHLQSPVIRNKEINSRSSSNSRQQEKPGYSGGKKEPEKFKSSPAKQNELLERHINQLFIRGDNVVMVAYA